MVDAQNPQKSMIDASINKLSILSMIEAFSEDVDIRGDFRTALESGLEDLTIRVVPSPLTIFNESYEPGLNIKGKTNLFGLKGEFELLFDPVSKIYVYGAVDPIKFESGGVEYFSLKGAGSEPKAKIDLLLSTSGDMHFIINGSLTILGATSSSQIQIDKTGLEALVEMDLFGKDMFSASLEVTAKDFKNGGDFYVQAVMKNKLQKKLSQEVRNYIDNASKEAQREFRKLEKEMERAKNGDPITNAFINLGKETVGTIRKMDARLANAANYLIKDLFEELLLIEYASFEGKLQGMKNAQVEMKIQGVMLGDPLNTKFSMKLDGQVDQMIEKLAKDIGDDILQELEGAFAAPLNKMLNEAETFFTDLGSEIGKTFEEGVGFVEQGAEEVGDGIEAGANGVASGAKQLWNAIGL